METVEKIEPYYQTQAKDIIDSMFNNKVFNSKMTRDDMQGFEDLIAFYFQSHANTVRKCAEFSNSIKHLK
jgi:hypothetical protein